MRRDFLGTGAESWSSLELNERQFVLIEENNSVQVSHLADNAKNAEVGKMYEKSYTIKEFPCLKNPIQKNSGIVRLLF